MHTGLTDIELWNAAMDGDRDSFGQLFHRYYNLLFHYGSKISADRLLLEDCIQELFVELWQKKSATEIISVKAYLLKALKFKLYKALRRSRSFADPENNETVFFEISHEHFIIGQEETAQRMSAVVAALSKLSPRQKEVIYLKIFQDLSYDEVGAVMQLNYQVVRNLLSQSIKALRKILISLMMLSTQL